MLTATTRAPVKNPAVLFGGERGTDASYSRIVVSIPHDRKVGTIQFPRTLPGNAATSFVVNSATPVSHSDLAKVFQASKPGKRRAFVFVHGYNTSFDQAVFRFAQLSHDVDADAVPILFSWPSRGHLLDYKRDLDNASYSRTDLADLLLAAARSPSIDEVVILAHSMGGWLAVEALRQIALQRGGVPDKITDLILASPDLDIGVFRRQIEDMGPKRPRITVFVSQNDRALQLSRFIARGGTRLGGIDVSQEGYRRQLSDLSGVTIIDLSTLSSGDRIDHSLFATSPAAVQLIGDRLLHGQIIDDRAASDTASALDAIGSAAGLVLSTPILIFDAASARAN
jgi:esterase/lipase superfamily enzyme